MENIVENTFMTMAEFKVATESKSFSIKKNPKTDKLFAVNQDGRVFKVQGGLDLEGCKTRPNDIRWIMEAGKPIDEACLILTKPGTGAETLAEF
tara:strand:+ start:6006 stop:6287 length:282 start_codon:yes stop_codon:yes gene_type:complete